jgi:hypothetical protein
LKAHDLQPLVGDLRQFASVRSVVLDDGGERGLKALLFTTGGGLDFMVLADRAMDIGTMSFRGLPLAWQSPAGFRRTAAGDAESESGRGFNRSFSGLLVTCGLDHIRQPAGGFPLHGRLPGTPARLLAHGEDWSGDTPLLYCEGEVMQTAYGAESFILRRRIEAPIGGNSVTISDEVENIGPEPWPHEILYHLNFGYPAVDDGAALSCNGAVVWDGLRLADTNAQSDVACLAAGAAGEASAELRGGSVAVTVTQKADTLPYMQFWRDLRPRVGVIAIEPCSTPHPSMPEAGPKPVLAPGEKRRYRVTITAA